MACLIRGYEFSRRDTHTAYSPAAGIDVSLKNCYYIPRDVAGAWVYGMHMAVGRKTNTMRCYYLRIFNKVCLSRLPLSKYFRRLTLNSSFYFRSWAENILTPLLLRGHLYVLRLCWKISVPIYYCQLKRTLTYSFILSHGHRHLRTLCVLLKKKTCLSSLAVLKNPIALSIILVLHMTDAFIKRHV